MADVVKTTPADRSTQNLFDAAVVIPTVLRPSLKRAVTSVYRQRFEGTIQVLVGIDKHLGDAAILDELERDRPANRVLTVLDLGYSTSVRHGGLIPGGCGGALRTVLSYVANSRRVAYLDDDNWWGEDHIRTLCKAIEGHDWAFSLRWYVDPDTQQPLCVDQWESVGPDAGAFKARFGGFVDPNCLMVDRVKCEPGLRWWCIPLPGEPRAMSEDRNIFNYLRQNGKWRSTGQATSYYVLTASDAMHAARMQWAQQKAAA
jgi:hypothetical protein